MVCTRLRTPFPICAWLLAISPDSAVPGREFDVPGRDCDEPGRWIKKLNTKVRINCDDS